MNRSGREAASGGSGMRDDLRQRAAYHEAGHALVFCLTYFADCDEGDDRVFECLVIDGLQGASGMIPYLQGEKRDPWKDALVHLGGHAAEDVAFGEHLDHYQGAQDDWRKAERLLRKLGMYDHARDAFQIARELLSHNRAVLDAMARALLERGALDGERIRALFTEHRPADPGPC